MKRFAVVFGLVVLAAACDKPSEDNCRKAITNMRTLFGSETSSDDIAGDIRRCKGGWPRDAVECAAAATTAAELRKCSFFKDKKTGSGAKQPEAGSGSAK